MMLLLMMIRSLRPKSSQGCRQSCFHSAPLHTRLLFPITHASCWQNMKSTCFGNVLVFVVLAIPCEGEDSKSCSIQASMMSVITACPLESSHSGLRPTCRSSMKYMPPGFKVGHKLSNEVFICLFLWPPSSMMISKLPPLSRIHL